MVSAASKGAATAQSNKAKDKKPVTPREDPVKRAERLLEEARLKAKANAEKSLDNARKDLAIAQANAEKWQGFVNARQARVDELERQAGIAVDQPIDAESYAEALSDHSLSENPVPAENQG